MELNERIHGFRLLEQTPLPELDAVLHRMVYEKNGAELIWLRREDENKTFAITFKTIPSDDTGVFHILEHSVLCGSRKYPVKEPFVELLKSSLQTFLNAFTFPDKTMYPVSSRNPRDFLNLMDVYLDATLHPLSISDPHAFRQEGWHYELDSPEGELRLNGVVYNEMKGAYASPDTILQAEMDRLLFPDTCYGYESGGYPEAIPTLTYENYLESHRRYYHPSNARIFLDGDLDLDAALEKIDSYLRDYDFLAVDAEIPMQEPVLPPEKTCFYEIGQEEDLENKAILARGWVFGDFSEQEKAVAGLALTELLCGSNEAPLKKALLEAGLAEDVEFQTLDGIQQQYVLLVVRNTDPEKRDAVWDTVDRVLREQTEKLDREHLHALLNHLEFVTREKDFGSMPRGLAYAMSAMESWLYDGDPAQNLCYDGVFSALREKLDRGYFEDFIRSCLLDCPHQARLLMLPSKTLGQEKQEAEKARLAALKATWDGAQVQTVMEEFAVLRRRQGEQDTPEQLALLPQLSLSDIPETVSETPQTVGEIAGRPCLHQEVNTGGILYLDLVLSLKDRPLEELGLISFFSRLLTDVATEHYDVNQLHSRIEGNLGRFAVYPRVYAPEGTTEEAMPCLVVSLSLLDHRKEEALRLLEEVLLRSDFSDAQIIYNLLRQRRLGVEQSIVGSGNAYARQRVAASFSAQGAVTEALQGIAVLRQLQSWDRDFETGGEALCAALAALPRQLFARARATVSITGPRDDAFAARVLDILTDAPMGEPVRYEKMPVSREGYLIPADVAFAAKGGNLAAIGEKYSGAGALSAQILTYGYLWNTIRVQGGAYGTGLAVNLTGDVIFSSYRDPGAAKSLVSFDGAGEALRAVADSGDSLDKYIISTLGALDPLLTPRMEGQRGLSLYLTGRTHEDRLALRRALLHATAADLTAFSAVLDRMTEVSGVCVVGGKDQLDRCDGLDRVEAIVTGNG